MAKYDYHGPVQHIPLRTGERKSEDGKPVPVFTEFALAPGMTGVSLPENNPIVEAWLDAGLIEETETTPSKPLAKPTKPQKGSEE